MKFNPDLIQKARKGEIAILNDGSVEELQKVISEVFPNDLMAPRISATTSKYFLPHPNDSECWMGETSTTLPAHSVKDFFLPSPLTGKEAEVLNKTMNRLRSETPTKMDQSRTYKVTRGQMKEIWQILPVDADGEEFRNSLKYLFDPFENEAELNEAQVKRIMKNFPEVQPSKLRSIFPSYFYIPEGEPVLYQNERGGIIRIGISDGKGHVYLDNRTEGLPLTVHHIIPFTKNPPK